MSICHCFRLCSHIQHKQNKNKDPSRQQQKAPCLLFLCHSGHTPGCSPVPSPGSLCLRDLAQVPHPGMYRLSWECLGTHGTFLAATRTGGRATGTLWEGGQDAPQVRQCCPAQNATVALSIKMKARWSSGFQQGPMGQLSPGF